MRALPTVENLFLQILLGITLIGLYAVGTATRWHSPWWLAGLTAIWLGLVAISPENLWIAFSLWLLAGQILTIRFATGYVLLTLAVLMATYATHQGGLTMPEILGPSIGAFFALIVSRGQIQLVRESADKQRLVDSIIAAQAETEHLQTELAAAHREAGAQAERTRLSGDIHDTLAQGFSSIVLLARAGKAQDEAGLRHLLTQIESTAGAGLAQAREVVAALAPSELADTGLPAALKRLADALHEQTGITAEVRTDGDLAQIPTALEVALLRTAQGALANVRRHARPGRVVLSLSGTDDAITLDVADDGVGYDPSTERISSPQRGGYGLAASRTRLQELGGSLDIDSAPGEGTTLTAIIPRPGRPHHPEQDADARKADQ